MSQINEEEGAGAPAQTSNTVGSGKVDMTPAAPTESPRRRKAAEDMKAAVAKNAARTFQATKPKK